MTRIVLKGRTQLLKPVITEILAIHQLVESLDMGQFVGYPWEEFVKLKRQTPLCLDIVWYSVPVPPWKKRNKSDRFVRASYAVPDIKRSALDWEQIKTAAGGKNGYSWGRFRATANLSNGGQMQVHGGSENEAEERLKALLSLSTAEIVTLSTTEEKKEGRRAVDKKLYKETTRVFPAYFTVTNREKVITESNLSTLEGDFHETQGKINLWTEEAPPNLREIIAEVLRVRGANPS
ncbi:hypothetical protein NDI44_08655 [Trichocoleus sp. DQ-A3]|uniref:hypothetical protein n=1 Tax=Cyanophyceae TaxID=3028117 RepID=UPI0016830F79|nr:hypothetical protein [Coleofasciculus sp. FACHB-125]MBD1899261.1 hypothetical protein [Coleofasciculus sp. FACHB-125]